MRRGVLFLLRLGMLAAALSLAILVSVVTATTLHSEPGAHRSAEEAAFAEPMAGKRPVAIARGFQKPEAPSIRPEPAVPPELRNLEPEPPKATPPPAPEPPPPSASEKAKQQKAERQKAKAERQKAERQKAEQQRAERQKAERQRAERREAERRKAKAEREKAERSSAARRVLPLPAERAGGARAEKARPAPAGSGTRASRPVPRGGKMALSINSIGLRNSPIKTTDAQRALDNGLIHLPQTSRPWERGKARNVYVVGHRMGWPGTKSWKIFYRLDELQRGDRLVLTAGGKTYRYRVSEKLVVAPWDVWVTEPVKGRDLLTLQTCTGPNFGKRLIVRADRV